jgi:uncharacterized protein
MIVVELEFNADPRRLEARAAHRAVLQRLRKTGQLVMAGPLEDDSGALLIFDTDPAELNDILTEDPYYRAPGVTVVSRRPWHPLPLC